jgi:hypothetical protein
MEPVGFIGVSSVRVAGKAKRKWRASHGSVDLGVFDAEEQAAEAYDTEVRQS